MGARGLGLSLVGVAIAMAAQVSPLAEAAPKKTSATLETNESCEGLLVDSDEGLTALDARFEEYPIDALLQSDPEKNLAVKYPSIVMNADQIYWHAILRYPVRTILDPTYPVRKHEDYPIFSDGVPEADGSAIIFQYPAKQRVVNFIRARAAGKGDGNMLMLVGPAGTGKTEYLNIIDRAAANLALKEPDHYQYTFRWQNMHEIPYLKPLINPDNGELLLHSLERSPLTLLSHSPRLQEEVVRLATPRVREVIGFNPIPFTNPDPQTDEILNHIVSHYRNEWKLQSVSESDYVRMLRRHVKIVRRVPDLKQPPALIRYKGKHPDPSQLFASENPYLKLIFGSKSALSYDYNGEIVRADGRGAFFDEFFRQEESLRNSLLDFAQNGVLEGGGAPAIKINTVPLLATNDENVDEAREEGGSKAHLDRLIKEPMRQPLHPLAIAKTAMLMAAAKTRFSSVFEMRPLESSEVLPGKLNELYTNPTEKGEMQGPDGRYAMYYSPAPNKRILIAPHSLELLGMTVAGTRLSTNLKELEKHAAELGNIVKNIHYFTDAKARLEIITRKVQVQAAVLADLYRIMYLLREGENGISARDAERWFSRALEMALSENRGVLTPVTMDRAFQDLLMRGEFVDKKSDLRARWLNLHSMVKADFIMPALTSDIQGIVGGDSGLVTKLYDEIKSEIEVLANQPDEHYWYDDGGERHPINMSRLEHIKEIYEQVNNEPFTLGRVKTFLINRQGGEKFQPLVRAIEHFLLNKELDTNAIGELLDYFDGKSVSEETRVRGRQAEASLERFGYDRQSFREALAFVRDQQYELKRRQSGQQ